MLWPNRFLINFNFETWRINGIRCDKVVAGCTHASYIQSCICIIARFQYALVILIVRKFVLMLQKVIYIRSVSTEFDYVAKHKVVIAIHWTKYYYFFFHLSLRSLQYTKFKLDNILMIYDSNDTNAHIICLKKNKC